jgi:DNA-binding NarL/FixJ family response regulator
VIRVLVADDEALVRGGFRMILEAQADLEVVGEATNGQQALTQVRELSPDVVLMDIRMPIMDGLEATRQLLTVSPTPPKVLMLTTFDLDEYVYQAMKVGASGFLLKTAPPSELAAAVRAVVGGEVLLAPPITRRLVEEFVRRPPPGQDLPPNLRALTAREVEVLRLVAGGLSNAEIAKVLFLGEATVKTHLNRVLAKLGLRDRVQAVVLAYETGLVAPGREEAPSRVVRGEPQTG